MSLFRTDGRTESGTDGQIFLKILTYIHMTHINFLFHRLLVSETQTDRQTYRHDKFVIEHYRMSQELYKISEVEDFYLDFMNTYIFL